MSLIPRSGFAWFDACNRKPKAELLLKRQNFMQKTLTTIRNNASIYEYAA